MPEAQQQYQQQQQQRGSPLTSSTIAPSDPEADPHLPTAIPPWVHINGGPGQESEKLLVPPNDIVPNTRHFRPSPQHYKPGRKWDQLRSAEPPFLSRPINEHQQRWRAFMEAGPSPGAPETGPGEAMIADASWLEENMPHLNPPWSPQYEIEAGAEDHAQRGLVYRGMWLISPERQERTVRLFLRLLLKNPFVPLAFRITVLAFSAAALGISVSLYLNIMHVNHDSDPDNQCTSRASTTMGIAVDSVALPYIFYVTWDEYMSKPLGLRSVAAKIALLLCDLYFIVFSASNVSLAFDALYDRRWACYDEHFTVVGQPNTSVSGTCPNNARICSKQQALSGVLIVSLIAWLMTFSISVLRVVEKLRPD